MIVNSMFRIVLGFFSPLFLISSLEAVFHYRIRLDLFSQTSRFRETPQSQKLRENRYVQVSASERIDR